MKNFLYFLSLSVFIFTNTSSHGMFVEYEDDSSSETLSRSIIIEFRDIRKAYPSQATLQKETQRRKTKLSHNKAIEYNRTLDLSGNDSEDFFKSRHASLFTTWVEKVPLGSLFFFGIDSDSQLESVRNCLSLFKGSSNLLNSAIPLSLHFDGALEDTAKEEARETLKNLNVRF